MAGMGTSISCDQGAGFGHFHPAQEIVAKDTAPCLPLACNHNDGAAAACLFAGKEGWECAPGRCLCVAVEVKAGRNGNLAAPDLFVGASVAGCSRSGWTV